jgi:hypothetical protein
MEKVFTLFEFTSTESRINSIINLAILLYFMYMVYRIYLNTKK